MKSRRTLLTKTIFVLVLFSGLAISQHVYAATYYVDSAGGSDSNNGTSISTPWQTISKVNGSTFSAGDQILFKAGDTWREQLTVPSSGSAGNPITFGAHGSGAAPILNEANLLASGWSMDASPATTTVFITSGTSFTVPVDWNNASNSIEVIGGGGAGADGTNSNAAGAGGGGGAYSRALNVALTPSASVTVHVGAGGATDHTSGTDSYFCNSASNCASIAGTAVVAGAHGGTGATSNSVGATGGSTTGAVGAVKYAGGNGGNSVSAGVGGGGGAAGPNGPGGNAGNGGSGGSAASGGGGGGGGGSNGADGTPASGGKGGNNSAGTGGGAGGVSSAGSAGTNGGGGGGDDSGAAGNGGAGGAGTEWDSLHGSGGGGGGGEVTFNGGNGGLYGGGGAGSGASSNAFGTGANGLIVLSYATSTPNSHIWETTVTTQPNQVFFNGVLGIQVSSKAQITAATDWYWASNVLYVYSPSGGSPSVQYTSPGVEASQRAYGIYMDNKSYVTVTGLTVTDANSHGIEFDDVESHITVNASSVFNSYSNGINTNSGASDLLIENSTIAYSQAYGVFFSYGAASVGHENIVQGSTFYDNAYTSRGQAAIQFTDNYDIAQNNLLYNNGTTTADNYGIGLYDTTGLWAQHDIVRYNVIYGQVSTALGGSGICADNNAKYADIYGNISYGNSGPGIAANASSYINIYNNTVYGNDLAQTYHGEITLNNSASSIVFKNNIAYATVNGDGAISTDPGTSISSTNNIWYAPNSTNWYSFQGTAGNNLSTWNGLTGGTDLNTNPFLTNAAGHDFSLLSTSPAIDAGANLGSTYQLGLAPGSTWPASVSTLNQNTNGLGWDVGAYVYTESTPPTVSLTAPSDGSTVSGPSVPLSATASDNSAVAGVQFKLDTNTDIGTEDTDGSYGVAWDSTAVADGSLTIIAVARDTYGNYATSTPITVIVHNAVASSGGGSSGGGGWSGGCSTYPQGEVPSWGVVPCTPTNPSQGHALLPGTQPSPTPTSLPLSVQSQGSTPSTEGITLSKNHQLWDKGEDIRTLQKFFNTHGFIIAAQGPGSPGNETSIFGSKTYRALIKFQKANNLPATGYLGPLTRATLASLSATSTTQ